MDKQYMSNEAQEAFTVHAQIITGFQMQEDGIYLTAKGYKLMRDKKLYKPMGYDTFEKYCEAETGISRKQVYQYIRIAEKIPEQEFVTPGLQIGVKKLYLLSALTEEQRAEIVESTDLENTSVKELKDQIARLAGEKLRLKTRMEEQEELIDSLRDEISNGTDVTKTDKYMELQSELKYYEGLCRDQEAEIVEKAAQLADLEREMKELKSRPIEVQATTVPVEETEEYKRVAELSAKRRAELLRVCGERNAARAEVEELKKQLKDPDNGVKRYVIRLTEKQLNEFCRAVKESCPEYTLILREAEMIE